MSLQTDLEALDSAKAGIFFVSGSFPMDRLQDETAKRIRAGMKAQHGWVLDECEATYDPATRHLHIRVTNGLSVGDISFLIPDAVEIVL